MKTLSPALASCFLASLAFTIFLTLLSLNSYALFKRSTKGTSSQALRLAHVVPLKFFLAGHLLRPQLLLYTSLPNKARARSISAEKVLLFHNGNSLSTITPSLQTSVYGT